MRGDPARSEGGTRLYAVSSGFDEPLYGIAIRSAGRLLFDEVSGIARIPAGLTTKTVRLESDVKSTSFVLLTPRTNIGTRALWYVTDPSNDRITIKISSPRAVTTSICWLFLG